MREEIPDWERLLAAERHLQALLPELVERLGTDTTLLLRGGEDQA